MFKQCGLAWVIFACGASFFGGVITAQAQLTPPPPVTSYVTDTSFTDKDRRIIQSTFRMVRAIHARLFPLSNEQKILDGGTVIVE